MPKLKYIIEICIAAAFTTVPARTQTDVDSSHPLADTRTMSIYVGAGALEFLAGGVQYQLSDKFAVAGKADIVFLGGEAYMLPPAGGGGGLKVSYFFDRTGSRNFLGLNCLNLEGSYLQHGVDKSAGAAEFTFGHDAIDGRGLKLLWAVGVAYSTSVDEAHRQLVFPAIKVGIHFDI